MSTAAPAGNETGLLARTSSALRRTTGESLAVWIAVALLNLITQVIFCRNLHPGEFGTLNSIAGVILLMTVPMHALHFAFGNFSGDRRESLRSALLVATETFTWFWAALSCVLIFLVLTCIDTPRFSLQLFALLSVLVALGGWFSRAICIGSGRLRVWATLLMTAAVARALAAALVVPGEPFAEGGLAAFLIGGFVLLAPAMRSRETDFATRLAACRAALDRDFLLFAGAAASVFLAMFLFSSADRIVSQVWLEPAGNMHASQLDPRLFDAYQTAGLLGRGLLWGTQPLLWALYLDRSRLPRTNTRALTFFWLHLAALVLGGIVLALLAPVLAQLFCGENFTLTRTFIPTFAAVMLPLGLLQALGIFALASRRWPECFTLGGCGVAYAFALFFLGHRPEVMLSYMFGGALISLMAVLAVGVVRWGRRQP